MKSRRKENEMETVSIFNVEYRHLELPNGDEMYFTVFGLPFLEFLRPENFWLDREWFDQNAVKLFGHDRRFVGTSRIYRVRTKPVGGRRIDLVLKWNRMGQDVPGAHDSSDLAHVEFNSPYEEFERVMELRRAPGPSHSRIRTHKPLAIYLPNKQVALWRSGRSEDKMRRKMRDHPIELDLLRPYAVIYEWIKGIDAAQACREGFMSEKKMRELTLRAERDMRSRGFVVRDRKPQHVIVRESRFNGKLLRDRSGRTAYGMVDFELLERTPQHERTVQKNKRREYLRRQARRFEETSGRRLPPHLRAVNIFGVDYVTGPAESTNGALWVVGKDPSLFDYFLPERWRGTPRERLSTIDPIYYTRSKDMIQLVWRISRVGLKPDADPFDGKERLILEYGYNSPFEEVSLAFELAAGGVNTTYPRAIYMTGQDSRLPDTLRDGSRYASHAAFRTQNGTPLLRDDREYVVIWGYFNKPDTFLARADRDHYRPIDALSAFREGILESSSYVEIMSRMKESLSRIGIEDLNLRGSHVLLSLNPSGKLIFEKNGMPACRICNFELLRRSRPEK
jgi:hypothetical protein